MYIYVGEDKSRQQGEGLGFWVDDSSFSPSRPRQGGEAAAAAVNEAGDEDLGVRACLNMHELA